MKHLAFQVLVKGTSLLEDKLIDSLLKVILLDEIIRQYWREFL
jgi:hypothetical protein